MCSPDDNSVRLRYNIVEFTIERKRENMTHRIVRFGSLMLVILLVFALSASAMDAPPPPPPGGGSFWFYTGDAVTDLDSGDYTEETFPDSMNATEVALRVGPGVTASLTDCAVTKTSGDLYGDDSSFYGVNAGVLAYSEDAATPAELTIKGGTVETGAGGANGIFAYGNSTIDLEDVTVTTTGAGGAGGIMVAGGGTLYAKNCTVTTEGGSSAAIRSDRGSGVMVIDGGTYISNGSLGTGSPAIYCVADITAANATLSAGNAQAICFEGRNPFHMYNCFLEGNYTASDDDENCNVMVYQSMSGDSEEGTTYCTMVGGVLKANNVSENGNAKMFYTTNTYCYISLSDVQMEYAPGMETFLLCACNTNRRGWGRAGTNGSECVLYTKDQRMEHNIIFDTWSYLGCFMTEGSEWTGALLCRENNGERGCDLYLDESSVWNVTGDSVVRDLYTGGGAINGAKIVDPEGNVLAGDGEYTVTVYGTYSEEDHSGYEYVPGIGTVKDGEYTFDTEAAEEYVNLDYVPTAPDGTVYETAAWNYEETLEAEEAPAEDSALEEAPASAAEEAPEVEQAASDSAPDASAQESQVEETSGEENAPSRVPVVPIAVGAVAVIAAGAGIGLARKKKS